VDRARRTGVGVVVQHDQLGDISTLADPSVVANLVTERMNR
jgi:hypothetical protein